MLLSPEKMKELEVEILSANKKVMKEMLNLGRLGLPTDEKFKQFKTSVFNNFGKSGLETELASILQKYTEEESA